MVSASGRYVMAFNGEIYNFRRLREEPGIREYPLQGHSDTEVVLAAIEHLGVEHAVKRLQGMFAVSLWDREERCLWLARDRVGKKPLYYGWCNNSFLYGSELKALRRHPAFDGELDRNALGQYLQYGWISQPQSIYQEVRKLPPGSLLKVPYSSVSSQPRPQPQRYWSAAAVAEQGQREPFSGSYEDATDALEQVLLEAVSDRMVADVELGALLSGGIDSSMIVALMQRVSEEPVKTFSIGFEEEKYNEAGYARAVAEHLKTDHHEMVVSPEQTLKVVDLLPHIYDEPFADASQIPTYLVSKLAKEQLTVVLTGDGGDEQMAGYPRYLDDLKLWREAQRIPGQIRRALQPVARGVVASGLRWADRCLQERRAARRWTRKLAARSRTWSATSVQQVVANRLTGGVAVDQFVAGAVEPVTPLTDPSSWARVSDPLLAMLHFDYTGYMTEDILVKVDRASMAVGLEARASLLDQRVLELVWSFPRGFLVDGDVGKRVLKDLLMRYVPRDLIDRPKRGFSVPIKEWLKGPLRDWAEDLLSEQSLQGQGIFKAGRVREAWHQHLQGWRDNTQLLWAILMFQTWWRAQADERP